MQFSRHSHYLGFQTSFLKPLKTSCFKCHAILHLFLIVVFTQVSFRFIEATRSSRKLKMCRKSQGHLYDDMIRLHRLNTPTQKKIPYEMSKLFFYKQFQSLSALNDNAACKHLPGVMRITFCYYLCLSCRNQLFLLICSLNGVRIIFPILMCQNIIANYRSFMKTHCFSTRMRDRNKSHFSHKFDFICLIRLLISII